MIKTIGWIFFTFWLIAIIVLIGIAFYSSSGELSKPELTLDDAVDIFDFSAELPSDYKFSTSGGETMTSDLLGVSSISIFYVQGVILEEWPWCEIQCMFWIVDDEVAEQVSAEEALDEYNLDSPIVNVDLGESVEAVLYGGGCSGLDFLMIKYGKVYILMDSWYSHPRDKCISLTDLGEVVVQRLNEYSLD